jgi:hypothetical protein
VQNTSVREIDKLYVSQPDAEFAVFGPYSIGRPGGLKNNIRKIIMKRAQPNFLSS